MWKWPCWYIASFRVRKKKKIECLIIEAGDEFYSEKTQSRYVGEVYGNFPNDLSVLRLSQFGGTTGHWGGTCRTLDEYDFQNWPIKSQKLIHFWIRVVKY